MCTFTCFLLATAARAPRCSRACWGVVLSIEKWALGSHRARVTSLCRFSCPRAGGLDDTLHTIIDYACEQDIPFVFALNRKALGRSLNKAVPVSVVGIFSYDGAQVSERPSPLALVCGQPSRATRLGPCVRHHTVV